MLALMTFWLIFFNLVPIKVMTSLIKNADQNTALSSKIWFINFCYAEEVPELHCVNFPYKGLFLLAPFLNN